MTAGLRVAVLGVSGIGRVHARILHELGADVCAVLGSGEETSVAAAAELARDLGIQAAPFSSIERLLQEPLDAVSICTPPHLHFTQMLRAFDRGLPVFCEKPLLHDERDLLADVEAKLARIETHPQRRVFVNTSNAAFIDVVRDRLPEPDRIERFSLCFHTRGPWRGAAIAADLLPHALSLLVRLLGERDLKLVSSDSADHRYASGFRYGSCDVEVELVEAEKAESLLSFAVNGRQFRRVQEGRGATYRVFLADEAVGDRVEAEDPFRTYIASFLRYCRRDQPEEDGFREAAFNLRLMSRHFLNHASRAVKRSE